jgi:hypothetical protein
MLDIQQKAAAWEKPESHLSIEEMLYVSDPNAYDSAQEGCFDLEKLGKMQHQSAWVDVERKAKRILDNNQVDLYHKRPYDLEVPLGPVEIYGNIKGDHARYDAKIILPHPRSRAVRTWACQCTWARYVWNRAPAYKKFEGRLCSHVLALWWRSFNLPVEYEDVRPEVLHYYFPEMVGQQRLFDVDKYEAAEAVINKARIAPDIASSVYGIDLNILNKSLQSAFELVTAEEVISEIENKLDSLFAILFDSETSAEEIEQARDTKKKSLIR